MKKYHYLLIIGAIIAVACSCFNFETIKPSGKYLKQDRSIGQFNSVSVSSGFELILTQSPSTKLTIETYENIHKIIVTEIVDGTLKIHAKDNIMITGRADVKIYLSCNDLKSISSSGGGKVNVENGWKGDDLKIRTSGGGRIYGTVALNTLEMEMSGGSESRLSGTVEKITVSSSGGSSHEHFGLIAQECTAQMSGGASAEFNVVKKLSVTASGGTRVRYKGNPVVNKSVSGGSSVSAE